MSDLLECLPKEQLVFIANQSLIFTPYGGPESACCNACDEEEYCKMIQPDDPLKFQFRQNPCGCNVLCPFEIEALGENIVTNGTFDTDTSGWSIDPGWGWNAGKAKKTPGQAGWIRWTALLTPGRVYKIKYTVSGMTTGTLTPALGIPGPYPANFELGTPASANGTYELNITFTLIGAFQFLVFFADATFDGYIDDIEFYEVSGCWAYDAGVSVSDGIVCHESGAEAIIINPGVLTIGVYYQVRLTISGRTAGSIEVRMSTTSAPVSTNGESSVYLTADGTDFSIWMSDDFDGCIELCAVYKLRKDYIIYLIDVDTYEPILDLTSYFVYDGDWVTLNVETWSLLGINTDGCFRLAIYNDCCTSCDDRVPCFEVGGDINSMNPAFYVEGHYYMDADGTVVQWNGGDLIPVDCPNQFVELLVSDEPDLFPASCYEWDADEVHWKVVDCECNQLCNGDFEIAQGEEGVCWEQEQANATSEIDAGVWTVVFPDENPVSAAYVSQPISLCKCRTYNVCFDYSSDKDFGYEFIIEGVILRVTPKSAGSGTECFSFTIPESFVPSVTPPELSLGISSSLTATVEIDNFIITVQPFDIDESCPDFVSNCISFKNNHECTKLITAYCNEYGHGFKFGTDGADFRLTQRLRAISFNPAYPSVQEIQDESNGNDEQTHTQRKKYKTLHMDKMSETEHDCVSIQRLCEFLFIDTIEMVAKREEYQGDWDKDGKKKLVRGRMDLALKSNNTYFTRQ
jgi:hypothetical protein